MSQQLCVAVLQPDLRLNQPMSNMVALRKQVQELPSGTNIVVLPEMWMGLPSGTEVERWSRDGLQFLKTLAQKCDVNVIGGSFELPAAGGLLQNVCMVVDRGGEVVGRYVKRLSFSHEQATHQPGDGPGIFELDGFRVGVLICADLWRSSLFSEMYEQVDVVCVPAKTAVPTDEHVVYAQTLWHGLALMRASEFGVPVAVSDWACARHAPKDVDHSVGSVHSRGMDWDLGILHKRHRNHSIDVTTSGPTRPTASQPTSATPALGTGVHFTSGTASICNPGHRPDIKKIWQVIDRGAEGHLYQQIDLQALQQYRDYRRTVGLLPKVGE